MRQFLQKISWKAICMEVIGSFLVAVGIYNFAVNAEFPMTGFSGIAIILNRLFSLPVGAGTILLNIPVSFLCYKLLGRSFFFRSIRCMILSSLMIDYVGPLLPVYEGSQLLAAICTGVIAGLGYALIYMQNSSTGGSDFVVMAVKALRPHLSLGKIVFLSDMVIILAGGAIFRDVDGIIYGMIVNYLFATVVDKVMYGINSGKLTLIVTDNGRKICDVIDQSCGRGSTILKAAGGYQEDEKQVVMCACNNKQMYQVQSAVKKEDPGAFIIIMESNEVHGEGFRTLQFGDGGK
ncbi:YitT family protein [Cuneatibacter caecimuris]|uniref:Uncharacterized membrane-anchored protein YitT (DUF2179 family) n=1 Tax=Cuneatibacter caecimuris TaxID=1796618 RepID=A0A4V2F7V1_9FIRM|nr:YitT family protein [Cuneatibacter caecimuris]RZT01109.1 uncharacterized membrane-anchored protein YitT (DUF2179 family) [Cuneatibacter caecimuris]